MVVIIAFIIFSNTEKCFAGLSLMQIINFRRIFNRENKHNSLRGSYRSKVYLGSRTKIYCSGKLPSSNLGKNLTWHHHNKLLFTSKHYRIDNYGTLHIKAVSLHDYGVFNCRYNRKSKMYEFKHYLTVIQIPSRTLHIHFMYAVRQCTRENEEVAKYLIQSKVEQNVCQRNECELSFIHSTCRFQKFANPVVKVTVPVILSAIPSRKCNVDCSRRKMLKKKEEVKHAVITAVMRGNRLKIREEPSEMPISYLETEEDNICDPGFEMRGTESRSLCSPCSPGQFLEKGYCIPCHLNQYSNKYAATECTSCFGRRVTRSRGSSSEDDCMVADSDILWVLLAVALIMFPVIFICCCWSFVGLVGESALLTCFDCFCLVLKCDCGCLKRNKTEPTEGPLERKSDRKKHHASGQKTKAKIYFKHPKDSRVSSPASSAISSFAIPSVRHYTDKDFFDYASPLQQKSLVPLPPPPPESTRKRQAKNVPKKHGNPNKISYKKKVPTQAKHLIKFSPKTDDTAKYYMQKVAKNSPMYNAIMKSDVEI